MACVLMGASVTVCCLSLFYAKKLLSVHHSQAIATCIVLQASLALTLCLIVLHILTRAASATTMQSFPIAMIVLTLGFVLAEPLLIKHWHILTCPDAASPPAAQSDVVPTQPLSDAMNDMLSSREQEVLQLILKGHSGSSIAQRLFISEQTEKTYRKRIYQKLDVHSIQELFSLVASQNDSVMEDQM